MKDLFRFNKKLEYSLSVRVGGQITLTKPYSNNILVGGRAGWEEFPEIDNK